MGKEKKTKKPWLLKRWICKFLTWLDSAIFGTLIIDGTPAASAAQPFWRSTVAAFWCGVIVFVSAMFLERGQVNDILSIGAGVALAVAILFGIRYLYKTLGCFQSTGTKIFRTIYVLILCIVGCFAGFLAAYAFLFVLIFLFVLFVLYQAVFEKKPTITLDDGTVLTHEKGLAGEDYYKDEQGREYESRKDMLSGESFRRKIIE